MSADEIKKWRRAFPVLFLFVSDSEVARFAQALKAKLSTFDSKNYAR